MGDCHVICWIIEWKVSLSVARVLGVYPLESARNIAKERTAQWTEFTTDSCCTWNESSMVIAWFCTSITLNIWWCVKIFTIILINWLTAAVQWERMQAGINHFFFKIISCQKGLSQPYTWLYSSYLFRQGTLVSTFDTNLESAMHVWTECIHILNQKKLLSVRINLVSSDYIHKPYPLQSLQPKCC